MPLASWSERFKKWLEWCEKDESLPTYKARLREDGSIENKTNAVKNFKKEYMRVMDKQAWTGTVSRIPTPEVREQLRARRAKGLGVKAPEWNPPPPPPWEKPDFDASWFTYPVIDLGALRDLEKMVQGASPPGGNTFFLIRDKV